MSEDSTENPPVEDNSSHETERQLIERTRRWVDERSLTKADALRHPRLAVRLHWERNARAQIFRDIQRDIQTHGLQNPLTPEIVTQKAASMSEEPLVLPFKDTLTGEPFYQILRKNNGDLFAEERRTSDLSSDDNLISQAKLNSQGQVELTLNFSGERFIARDANPSIVHSSGFPNTTIRVFDTLSRSINNVLKTGQISAKPAPDI